MSSLNPDKEPEETMFNLTSKSIAAPYRSPRLAGVIEQVIYGSRLPGGRARNKSSYNRNKTINFVQPIRYVIGEEGEEKYADEEYAKEEYAKEESNVKRKANAKGKDVKMRLVNIPTTSSAQDLQSEYGGKRNLAHKWSDHSQHVPDSSKHDPILSIQLPTPSSVCLILYIFIIHAFLFSI